jgi:hypothetical protein
MYYNGENNPRDKNLKRRLKQRKKDEGLRIPSVKELWTLGIELGLLFSFSRTIKRGCR